MKLFQLIAKNSRVWLVQFKSLEIVELKVVFGIVNSQILIKTLPNSCNRRQWVANSKRRMLKIFSFHVWLIAKFDEISSYGH
jgi:hypothetical protein